VIYALIIPLRADGVVLAQQHPAPALTDAWSAQKFTSPIGAIMPVFACSSDLHKQLRKW
jgi:hypothetical protein